MRCDHKFVDSKACLKCGWKPVLEAGDKVFHFDGSRLEVVEIGEVKSYLEDSPSKFQLYCRAGQPWDSHYVMHRSNLFQDGCERETLAERIDSASYELENYRSFLAEGHEAADQDLGKVDW